jgi:ankyrin repeat protein
VSASDGLDITLGLVMTSEALMLAVVNDRVEAARVTLDAGAHPDGHLPLHSHSTPLHHAALQDDVELLELLVARGARTDVRDTLWNGTPHGWAVHEGKPHAAAYLAQFGAAGAAR